MKKTVAKDCNLIGSRDILKVGTEMLSIVYCMNTSDFYSYISFLYKFIININLILLYKYNIQIFNKIARNRK